MRVYATRYVRNAGGRVIHLSSCGKARGVAAAPWQWAEGKPRVELADMCRGFGYKACLLCRPFEED